MKNLSLSSFAGALLTIMLLGSACDIPGAPALSGLNDPNQVIDTIFPGDDLTWNFPPRILISDQTNKRLVGMSDAFGSDWMTYVLPNGGRPMATAVDGNGRIYIVDGTNSVILRIDDMTGSRLMSFGTHGNASLQFQSPRSIALDQSNRIYIADTLNNRIVRMDDMNGTNWISFGSAGSGARQLNSPVGIRIDPQNHIYIVDSGNNRIVRIDDMTGAGWTSFGSAGSGTNQFSNPTGLALALVPTFDWSTQVVNAIVVADSGNNRIVKIGDLIGSGWITLGSHGTGTLQFNSPQSVSIEFDGAIHVADTGNNRIVEVFDMSGTAWNAFGNTGSDTNQFDRPVDLFEP